MVAAMVGYIFFQCRESEKTNGQLLKIGAVVSLVAAIFAGASLGSPSCAETDDPIRGSCVEYNDDGYELESDTRAAKMLYFFALFYTPVVVGAFNRRK